MRGKLLLGAFVLAAVLFCGAIWYFLPGTGVRAHLEERLGISLPAGAEISSVDTHGGFHGDGTLLAMVKLDGQEELDTLRQEVERRWSAAPVDGEMLEQIQDVWSQYAGGLGSMPAGDAGPWLYRDRYAEQYGERCKFNPVLQNCTFAILDVDAGRLYVLENDC